MQDAPKQLVEEFPTQEPGVSAEPLSLHSGLSTCRSVFILFLVRRNILYFNLTQKVQDIRTRERHHLSYKVHSFLETTKMFKKDKKFSRGFGIDR